MKKDEGPEELTDELPPPRQSETTERMRMAERLLQSAYRELILSPDDQALALRIGEWLGVAPEKAAAARACRFCGGEHDPPEESEDE